MLEELSSFGKMKISLLHQVFGEQSGSNMETPKEAWFLTGGDYLIVEKVICGRHFLKALFKPQLILFWITETSSDSLLGRTLD